MPGPVGSGLNIVQGLKQVRRPDFLNAPFTENFPDTGQKQFRRAFLGFTPCQFPGGGFQFREAGRVG
jgi:hypothetical protein